jgi:hypothetical protein
LTFPAGRAYFLPPNEMPPPVFLRLAPAAALTVALLGAPHAAARAQENPRLEVSVDRVELKWSATGRRLGWLDRGTTVERLGGRSGWARLGVHGWMWSESLERAGDAWRVTPESENLRASRNGRVLGQLVGGVEVRRVGGDERWFEIEMIGWVPESAVRAGAAPAEETAVTDRADSLPRPAVEPPPESEPETVSAAAMGTLARAAELLNAPQGGSIAPLPGETPVRILESRGGWTHVRVDGWVPTGAVRAGSPGDVGPDVVAAAPPATFAGRTVRWTLEHVSLHQADAWRPDFTAGEWYALTRVPGVEGRYVYLAVPERLVAEFRDMSPFRTLRVEGRVRTGQSALTGTPIVDLIRLLP